MGVIANQRRYYQMYDEITGPSIRTVDKIGNAIDWVNEELLSGTMTAGTRRYMNLVLTIIFGGGDKAFYEAAMEEIPAAIREAYGSAENQSENAARLSPDDCCKIWAKRKLAVLH